MNDLVTLKKIEQSKLAIKEVKTLDEIKKIVNQSEALKAYAKSAQMSAEIQADIAELNIRAMRRLGEISASLESKKGGDRRSINVRGVDIDNKKTEALSKVGVSRQRANEAEKLAAIPEKVFETKIAEAKEASEQITKSLFDGIEIKQKSVDTIRALERIAQYRKTGVKPKDWIDGADDKLNQEADERDVKIEARLKEIAEKKEQEAKYQNDPFINQFQKYLDSLDNNAHRVAVCNSIMRICRQTLASLR